MPFPDIDVESAIFHRKLAEVELKEADVELQEMMAERNLLLAAGVQPDPLDPKWQTVEQRFLLAKKEVEKFSSKVEIVW